MLTKTRGLKKKHFLIQSSDILKELNCRHSRSLLTVLIEPNFWKYLDIEYNWRGHQLICDLHMEQEIETAPQSSGNHSVDSGRGVRRMLQVTRIKN